MEKIRGLIIGVYSGLLLPACYAADKFDILPDLPEPLASAAQASSVTTVDNASAVVNAANTLGAQSVGHEPNFISMVFSLVFVIILIYATGILYTKLNKFGSKALKRQTGRDADTHVSVLSTTPLGTNKTLHIVELNGRRMLLGASSNSIHLIKDLGTYPPCEIEGEYSKIEIPDIRIPKIEIPKIEFPGFTKVISRAQEIKTEPEDDAAGEESDGFEISEIYEEENPDGIIDKLFHTTPQESLDAIEGESEKADEHKVDPDEFALYRKYL